MLGSFSCEIVEFKVYFRHYPEFSDIIRWFPLFSDQTCRGVIDYCEHLITIDANNKEIK